MIKMWCKRSPPRVQFHQFLCTAKVVGNGAAKAIVSDLPKAVAREDDIVVIVCCIRNIIARV